MTKDEGRSPPLTLIVPTYLHHRLTNLRIVNLFPLDLTSGLNLIKVGDHAINVYCELGCLAK
ncbi:hypothetical protein [Coleofasciculus sp. E1-EBD-02]|uniref:hypothetical protein n=1 Tax=Coleofasciculus sp. E1-EBD-02 TaxID=3068481 RepID=UPI0032F84D3F